MKVARRVLRGPWRSNAPGLPDWRIGGIGVWLWVAATDDATIYDVARGRGFDQAVGLVPADYTGTIVRDGWVVYNSYTKASHQTCVAHYADVLVMPMWSCWSWSEGSVLSQGRHNRGGSEGFEEGEESVGWLVAAWCGSGLGWCGRGLVL